MASQADLVDPTKAGKYPVILSDELLGKPSTETFTGVRYNHKPDTNPSLSKLKVAGPSKYDLSYNDNGMYKYQGSRSGDGGQYVLIFDPSREVFVLHKVDSLFTMNLTQTPNNNSAAKLRQEFPHLEKPAKVSSGNINIPIHEKPKDTKGPATAAASAKGAKDSNTAPAKGKQKKETPAAKPKAAPKAAAAPAPPPKKPTPQSDDEEDSDDDDGGLVLEFPGGEEPSRDFSPAFPPRRFSEFVANGEEDDEDADGEEEEEDDMSEEEHFKLPSPMNPQKTQQQQQQQQQQQSSQQIQEPSPPQFSQPAQEEVESEEDEEEEEEEQQEDGFEDIADEDLEAQLEAELAASEVSEEE
ncbi:RNA polymerase II transcription elongation factor-domain-containing protein [Apiospora hydei]|uniref:RNA polymerase II transcription elongation factor-domain-containing protein n=1 Tax=Apiospora hydei TaxID=1337664 RepID=A0ABR1VTS5_9PEZI